MLIPKIIATLENYKVAITRTQFRELAMNFVAVQEHSDLISLEDLTERYLKTDGVGEKHFVDAGYNDSLAYDLQKPNFIIYDQRVDGAKATFVESNINCLGWGDNYTYFFYRDGGVKLFNMGLFDMSYPTSSRMKDCHFSKDGGSFSCKIILQSDVVRRDGEDSLVTVYEAGTYSITIDVDTCQYQIEKTA